MQQIKKSLRKPHRIIHAGMYLTNQKMNEAYIEMILDSTSGFPCFSGVVEPPSATYKKINVI